MTKFCGIYEIKNVSNEKSYIGSSKNINKRFTQHKFELKYNRHHNLYLQRAWNKYGENNFDFNIIEECDEFLLEKKEQWYLSNYNNGKLYNIGVVSGGDNISSHPNNEEIRKKMSQATKIRYEKMTFEERQKYSNNMKGHNNPNFGNTWNDALRDRVSKLTKERHKNNPKYAELARNIMNELWENMTDEEYNKFCQRMKLQNSGENNPFYGKSHTPATKAKLSNIHKERYYIMSHEERKQNIPQMKEISIDGVIYPGVAYAARILNIHQATLSYRVRSKNPKFKNTFFIDSFKSP